MGKQVRRGETSAWLVHAVVHGEDFIGGIFVGIDVHHPAEDHRLKAAVRGVAGFLHGDRTFQTKLVPIRAAQLPFAARVTRN